LASHVHPLQPRISNLWRVQVSTNQEPRVASKWQVQCLPLGGVQLSSHDPRPMTLVPCLGIPVSSQRHQASQLCREINLEARADVCARLVPSTMSFPFDSLLLTTCLSFQPGLSHKTPPFAWGMHTPILPSPWVLLSEMLEWSLQIRICHLAVFVAGFRDAMPSRPGANTK
jgi:hypothetical protein